MTETAPILNGAQNPLLGAHVIRAVGVKKVYRMGSEEIHALRGVDLGVKRKEYVSIMGPSGSGKSTLFNMIGGLDKPDEGQVYIDEVDIAALDTFELAWLRCHKIGYIFQTFNLIPVASALENVMMPMQFGGMNESDAPRQGGGPPQEGGPGAPHVQQALAALRRAAAAGGRRAGAGQRPGDHPGR